MRGSELGEDQLTGKQGGLLEIRRTGGKHLPARDGLAEHLDGSHVREIAAQARVVLFGGREPDAVVGGRVLPVAQDEDDPGAHVDRQAAEHGAGVRRKGGDGLQHELVRDGLSAFDGGEGVVRRHDGC